MFILSKENTYKLEETVKNKYGISELILMENAGTALFNQIKNTLFSHFLMISRLHFSTVYPA